MSLKILHSDLNYLLTFRPGLCGWWHHRRSYPITKRGGAL